MNAKTIFSKKFQELMASGGHILASLLDANGELQVSEIYGGELHENEDLSLSLFFSDETAPDFYRALAPSKIASMVVCSPFNMETYQVKGNIVEIAPLTEENAGISDYWKENYLLCLQNIGVPSHALNNISYRPTHRFKMTVNQVFLQTPHHGTGGVL